MSLIIKKFKVSSKSPVNSIASESVLRFYSPDVSTNSIPLGPFITGIHVENDRASVDSLGVNIIYADTKTSIRLFGTNFTNDTLIALTRVASPANTNCNDLSRFETMQATYLTSTMALITIKEPKSTDTLYLCAKNVGPGQAKLKPKSLQKKSQGSVDGENTVTQSDSKFKIKGKALSLFTKGQGNEEYQDETEQPIQSNYTVVFRDDPSSQRSTVIKPGDWIHQGTEPYLTIQITGRLLPLGLQITLICVLLCLTGLFAGLNLGLMSLDKNELKVIALKGDDDEKRYAKTIEPLRRRGNFLLCTILLSNVAINSTLTVLLDQLTSGILAIAISTILIVIIGDIVPQAICSRHGLAVGAKTIWITYLFMALTAPLSWPISKILDYALGDEIGQVYDRERLMEFIRITRDYSQLEPAEVNIISGALELKKKTVGLIMTCLEDVFMLPLATRLDFDTVSRIEKSGYSRIPIYKDDRKNIVGLLYVKDLAFVDPDDNMPLTTLIEYYRHPLIYTWEDTTLDIALAAFKEGKSHLSFVRRLFDDDDHTDPYYEVVGVVTLEDVIEEILQTEIVDETDVYTDNRLKQRRFRPSERDNSVFSSLRHCQDNTAISPQMILATYQFLSSSCSPFANQFITETILRRLLSQRIYFHHVYDPERDDPEPRIQIYTRDKPADYFVMILEGRVQVTAGKEQLTFYGGPFTSFGSDALKILPSSTTSTNEQLESAFVYKPDFTVEIIQTTTYLKITRKLYLSAIKASQMDRGSSNVSSKSFSFPPLSSSASLSFIIDSTELSKGSNNNPNTIITTDAQQPQNELRNEQETSSNDLKFNSSTEVHSFINPSFEMES
uniref:CNNM transmembrane domain-containing protein n=1 Tax=Tetranychus urticae TaxID=32264 RepID=T1KDX6_TETUR